MTTEKVAPELNYTGPVRTLREIIAALQNGAFVVCRRGTGKTRAIAMMMVVDPNAVAVVPHVSCRLTLQKYLLDYGVEFAEERVFLREIPTWAKTVYADELELFDGEWLLRNLPNITAATLSLSASGCLYNPYSKVRS